MKNYKTSYFLLCCFFSLTFNKAFSQELTHKISYRDSIIKIDSLVTKLNNTIFYTKYAYDFALGPILRSHEKIKIDKQEELKKLKKKLKRKKITQAEYNAKVSEIHSQLYRADSLVKIKSYRFNSLFKKFEIRLDSLKNKKAEFEKLQKS